MEKKWLFLLFFLIFFTIVWRPYSMISGKELVLLSESKDPFYEFSEEITSYLAEILPDKKTFDAVCDITYLREDIYGDDALITLYLLKKDENNKNIIIWSKEINEMKTPGAIKESAQEAVYLLLHRLSRDLTTKATPIPIIRPGAKKIAL